MTESTLNQLITMSRHLGDPSNDLVILGEGNTSARADADTFWVKASGGQLHNIDERGFVRVRFDAALAMLDEGELTDGQIKEKLLAATVDNADERWPSTETTFHALCLSLGGASFVGHTHPTPFNSLLCSPRAREAVAGRIFPDEIVVCGPDSAFVPYADPGIALARAIRDSIRDYAERHGDLPKVILLQNHGLIALGKNAQEVERITAMAVKSARIRLGACSLGGINPLSQANVDRIHNRPDEHYRQRILELVVPGSRS